MSKYVEFEQETAGKRSMSGSGAPFRKFKAGRQRIRFIGRLVQYDDWMYAKDGKPTAKVMSHALADGELVIVWVPRSIRTAICDYADGDERFIVGAEGRDFIVSGRGEGLNRRYSTMAGDKTPIPEGLDVEVLDRELLATGERLERLSAPSVSA